MVEEFTSAFNTILDIHAPVKIVQYHKNYAPYISQETKNQMKYRDLLKKSWHSTGDNEVHKEYKALRNKICKQLKEDKQQYYESKLNSHD